MKVFIWQEVLCDWTCGMIVVIADSLEDAIDKVRNEEGDFTVSEMARVKPTVIETGQLDQPIMFCVWGGG